MAKYIDVEWLIEFLKSLPPAKITEADKEVVADAFDEQFDRAAQSAALGVRFEGGEDDNGKNITILGFN